MCLSNYDLFHALSLRLTRNLHICLHHTVFLTHDASGGAERGEAYALSHSFRFSFYRCSLRL